MRAPRAASQWPVSAALVDIFACGVAVSSPSGAGEIQDVLVLVKSGDQTPDGTGQLSLFAATFSAPQYPVIQGGSQVAFPSLIRENGIVVGSGAYRAGPTPDDLWEIVREGDPSPDGNGNFGSFHGNQPWLINGAGQVALKASLTSTLDGSHTALLVGDGTSPPSIVVRVGQTPPGAPATIALLSHPSGLNSSGQTCFVPTLLNSTAAIVRGSGSPGSLVTIAGTGQSLPGGESLAIRLGIEGFLPPALNNSGQVAFSAVVAESPFPDGIFVGDGTDPLIEIVREGDPTPSGNGVFLNVSAVPYVFGAFSNHPMNEGGEVAFVAHLDGTSGGISDSIGLFLGDGSALSELVRRGDPVPDGNGSSLDFGPVIDLDDTGRVVFTANVTAASGGATSGLFIADTNGVEQILRRNDSAPGGGIFRGVFDSPSPLEISGIAAGVGVAFRTFANLENGGLTNDVVGIFLYDGAEVERSG